jgi:hypothetical protein
MHQEIAKSMRFNLLSDRSGQEMAFPARYSSFSPSLGTVEGTIYNRLDVGIAIPSTELYVATKFAGQYPCR